MRSDQTALRAARSGPMSARYLSFVGAIGLSSIGDAAWTIALASTVVGKTDATTAGAVLALAGVPRIAALLGTGAVADRYGPVRVMVGSDLMRCALMGAAAVAVLGIGPSVPLLIAVAALLGLLGAFFLPASGALRPQLLPPDELVRGNALYLMGLRAGQTAGGPVGAWLLGLGGMVAVAAANAVSFLVSAVAVSRSRPPVPAEQKQPTAAGPPVPAEPPASRPKLITQIAEGMRYAAAHRELRLLLGASGLVGLAGAGPINIGLVLLSEHLGAGAAGAGVLLSAFTVGAAAAFLVSLVLPVRRRPGIGVVVSVVAQAAALLLLGHVGSVVAAAACYAALGAAGAQASLILVSLIQRLAAVPMRGRVMAIVSLLDFVAPTIGNLALGAAVDGFGFPVTLALHAVAAAAALALFLASPVLRGARLD
ncbi:MFS transporter [Streptomyces sp. NPDC049813]|uniref:MFS transporter n=1 Tax=Streptomyces sp. NPDC049813 TaxID=3365597 RepID=UPI0037BA552D